MRNPNGKFRVSYAGRCIPQDQQTSKDEGFSSPQAGQRTGGPDGSTRRKLLMSSRARSACRSSSTHTWGSEDSIGSSPAMLEAWVLKRRARIPAPARWSTTSCASGRWAAL
jgi:hypothetical protein